MWASANGRKEIVEMLLQAGADTEAKRKVSSSSCLCQLSTGYNLVIVAVIVTVVVSYVDKRYSVVMIIITTQ